MNDSLNDHSLKAGGEYMNMKINLPQQRLSRSAIRVWIISEMIANLIGIIILGFLLYLHVLFAWKEWIGWVLIGITVISLLGTVWSCIYPFLMYKNWRYEIDSEFVQLRSGVLNDVYQLVPMTKIQAVATNQGPLLRKYGLCSVSIETMGSSHLIPALPKEAAIELRNQIAHYAKIEEVET
ncbi:uncharacterized protein ACUXHY_003785 [Cytobacillus horneckiae]